MANEGGPVASKYNCNIAYLVLTPKFDLAKWWPEWLLAEEVWFDRDENKWALQRRWRVVGGKVSWESKNKPTESKG